MGRVELGLETTSNLAADVAASNLLTVDSLSLRSNSRRMLGVFNVTTPTWRVTSSLASVMLKNTTGKYTHTASLLIMKSLIITVLLHDRFCVEDHPD